MNLLTHPVFTYYVCILYVSEITLSALSYIVPASVRASSCFLLGVLCLERMTVAFVIYPYYYLFLVFRKVPLAPTTIWVSHIPGLFSLQSEMLATHPVGCKPQYMGRWHSSGLLLSRSQRGPCHVVNCLLRPFYVHVSRTFISFRLVFEVI